jgi:hypothetical protein
LPQLGFGVLPCFVRRDTGVDGGAPGFDRHEGDSRSQTSKAPYGYLHGTTKEVLFSPHKVNRESLLFQSPMLTLSRYPF